MRLKRLIPGVVRRQFIARRRRRNHRAFFDRNVGELKELNWQREEWTQEWIKGRDPAARKRAKTTLDRQRSIICKLARTGDRSRELVAVIRELKIPGGLRELKKAIRSRRH